MMTASNIVYDIDEEKKIVKATISGCKNDAIDTILKSFRRQNLFLTNTCIDNITATYDPDKDTGTGENDPEDPCLTIDTTECDLTTCHKFLLKDTYTGIAVYSEDDPNPFSIKRGKEIARRRLYNTYNGDYMIALCNIINAIKDAIVTDVERARAITEERMINFKYYEYYNIFKGHLEE